MRHKMIAYHIPAADLGDISTIGLRGAVEPAVTAKPNWDGSADGRRRVSSRGLE